MRNLAILPDVFCWTKMGTEAGQPLDSIIARKDAERELGGGLFFWGIGTALGQKIWQFIDSSMQPIVLFSPMKSKPKKPDIRPDRIFVWTSYIDRSGIKHTMPDHIFVTSRAPSKTAIKRHHYALVCRKDNPLKADSWPSVDSAKLRNYKGNSQLGYSQVTAVVENDKQSGHPQRQYEVLFAAELVNPYYVKLSDPFELPDRFLTMANSIKHKGNPLATKYYEWLRSELNQFLGDITKKTSTDVLFCNS
jgi:hypothetical protein